MVIDIEQLEKETEFKAVLSGKKGGQHVNKVATQAQLFFHVDNSILLNDQQKERIKEKLGSRISSEGFLIVTSDGSRSQLKNKKDAFEKLKELLETALTVQKRRKKTRVPASVKRKRLEHKKQRSEIKKNRKSPL